MLTTSVISSHLPPSCCRQDIATRGPSLRAPFSLSFSKDNLGLVSFVLRESHFLDCVRKPKCVFTMTQCLKRFISIKQFSAFFFLFCQAISFVEFSDASARTFSYIEHFSNTNNLRVNNKGWLSSVIIKLGIDLAYKVTCNMYLEPLLS